MKDKPWTFGKERADTEENSTNNKEEASGKKKKLKKPKKFPGESKRIRRHIRRLKIAEFASASALALLLFISLVVLVVFQIQSDNLTYRSAATILNTYTGIVLGFVAMAVSLIGVVLSFHNTIQSEESNLSITEKFHGLYSSVEKLQELEGKLEAAMGEVSKNTIELNEKMKQLEKISGDMSEIKTRLTNISNKIQQDLDSLSGASSESVTNTPTEREMVRERTDEGSMEESAV